MWESLIGHACTLPNSEGGVVTLSCLPILVGNVIVWLLVLAGISALILIIISGFKFVTSGGDPKQADGARKTLTYAIIGLLLILFSFAIVRAIGQVTGVKSNCINRFGFTQCVPEDISKPCSSTNRDGFCTDREKECLPQGERHNFSCQYRCGARKGYCPGTKVCKVTGIIGGNNIWGCVRQ